MRHFASGLALSIAAMILVCGAEAVAEPASIYQATLGEADQKTPDLSIEAFRGILADGSATVIDARPRAEFVGGHVPGAVALDAAPGEAVPAIERLVAGDRTRPLVLYCNGPYCQASRRLSDELVAAGFTDVRRFQLGMPVWRAFGGPTEIELEGIQRVYGTDGTAVFLDARSGEDFAAATLPGAMNLPVEAAGAVKGSPMPLDDFNTRIVLFGRDAAQARALADALGTRPWTNVSYFPGPFEALAAALAPAPSGSSAPPPGSG